MQLIQKEAIAKTAYADCDNKNNQQQQNIEYNYVSLAQKK